ncbi:glycosyltransferase [Imhoffiella purpurea]|uniref:4,4'-diaponeurosporenoate glycosyltransferase n=1 Tax=Imhoffiella purpurea TaxID=1249627 RepID=W9VDE9_9GAMM|nr:glycosyltransferase family 2 protein [Imhoffiella purpurea]EXJ14067.1 4,4'-diaponeurosporenoate glycosyltransferase [Imhoffiella purpurea]
MLHHLLWLLLPWSLAFVFLGRMRLCPPVSSDVAPVRVSVVVPARNEFHRLSPLLDSMSRQEYPDCELIVVDDNSTDGTAGLARSAGATVISVTELEHGWLGKPHACWVGAQRASGDLLVFLDADTELEPGGLKRIVATHARHGGLVSVQPYHRMKRPYERLSALFFIIMMGSIRSFTLAGDAVRPNGSFGPCMVCSREDYFRTGGHSLVRSEIIDDVALSREMGRRGIETHNFIGRGTISFRMYPHGLGDLIEGWTKNFARGAMHTDLLILVMMVAWISSSFATFDAARAFFFEDGSTWGIPGLIAYTAYVAQIWWLLRRLGNFGLTIALTYPVSLLFFTWVFVRSLYLTLVRNSVRWKGRVIPVR